MQVPNLCDSQFLWKTAKSRRMLKRDTRGAAAPHSLRLRRLRALYGREKDNPRITQAEFAVRLKLNHKQYGNYETGYPISKQAEDALCELFPGLTVEWIRTGSRKALRSIDLADKLDQVEPPPGKRSNRAAS